MDEIMGAHRRILGCASQGTGSADEARLKQLLSGFDCCYIAFDRARKWRSFIRCLRLLKRGGFDLFALEGTGMAAGVAALIARILWKRPFIVSSGDAVAPFIAAKVPLAALFSYFYEKALCSYCSGFIGWTPYLVGRALTLGAPRAVTVTSWASWEADTFDVCRERKLIRQKLGIPMDAIVFGMLGSLVWSKRHGYCYGAELIHAAKRRKTSTCVLIVGDGTGLEKLRRLAEGELGLTIFLPGRVEPYEVPSYLAAMDIGMLPQSVDAVGSFRYTAKLPEYRRANLLIVTNQIPAAYDLDRGDMLRLKGSTPWGSEFIDELANLMHRFEQEDLPKFLVCNTESRDFNQNVQLIRAKTFVSELIESLATSKVTR